MTPKLKHFLLLIIAAVTANIAALAQDPANDPGAYITVIGTAQTKMNHSYMAYISASAHSSRKRKIEKMRSEAVDDIVLCQAAIKNLDAYKGDNSLKQNSLNYVQVCYKVFNEDYAHIVNMEDIAEKSYDEMQEYLLLQEATNDTLNLAYQRMDRAVETFAKKYGVNLVTQKTELGDKMEETNRMSKYHDKIYLLFFKCSWEDDQLNQAIEQKNVTKAEQVRSALDKYAIEGLAVLDTMKVFDNDGSLANGCHQALDFFKDEAENKIPMVSDYFLKNENFEKLKTTFDSKPANQRTQQDVDAYNKAVNDLNASINTVRQVDDDLNNGRKKAYDVWNATEKNFIDQHTPYYK
jgi:hypothetical protein